MTITEVARSTNTVNVVTRGTQTVVGVSRGQTYWGCGTGTGTETATDTTAPTISNEHVNAIGTNYVDWDWDTDELANCYVRAYTTSVIATTDTYIDAATHEHYVYGGRSFVVTGLIRDTTYWFRLYSADTYGNTGLSIGWRVKTAGDDGAGEAPVQE